MSIFSFAFSSIRLLSIGNVKHATIDIPIAHPIINPEINSITTNYL